MQTHKLTETTMNWKQNLKVKLQNYYDSVPVKKQFGISHDPLQRFGWQLQWCWYHNPSLDIRVEHFVDFTEQLINHKGEAASRFNTRNHKV